MQEGTLKLKIYLKFQQELTFAKIRPRPGLNPGLINSNNTTNLRNLLN